MRLEFNLRVKEQRTLPINYQYPISAWIYRTLQTGNPELSAWLHRHGYEHNGRHYKHFTFSPLRPGEYRIQGDRLEIKSPQARLKVSFAALETAKPFLIGAFQGLEFFIGDRASRAEFATVAIESIPQPDFQTTMTYRTVSPVCISTGQRNRNGRLQPQYLAPDHSDYASIFIENIRNKCQSINGQVPNGVQTNFECLNKPRSKLITIKAGTPQESRVRGYEFTFRLTAPVALHRMGWDSGFGQNNSLGFGFCEPVEG